MYIHCNMSTYVLLWVYVGMCSCRCMSNFAQLSNFTEFRRAGEGSSSIRDYYADTKVFWLRRGFTEGALLSDAPENIITKTHLEQSAPAE